MTSRASNLIASPTWGAPRASGRAARRPLPLPGRGAGAPRFGVTGRAGGEGWVAVALLAAWVGLWTVFLGGVVEPAARVHAGGGAPPAAQLAARR